MEAVGQLGGEDGGTVLERMFAYSPPPLGTSAEVLQAIRRRFDGQESIPDYESGMPVVLTMAGAR